MTWRPIKAGDTYQAPVEGGVYPKQAPSDGIVVPGYGFIPKADILKAWKEIRGGDRRG